MGTWDPGGALEPNVDIDVVKPVYKFGGQSIQWGERFPCDAGNPNYDNHYYLDFTNVGNGFDVLQWFIDTYGIDSIPHINTDIYFNNSGTVSDPTDPSINFIFRIQWSGGKCFFGGGFNSMAQLNNIPAYCNTLYSYSGCDLDNITVKDHQLATIYFFKPQTLTPDGTVSVPLDQNCSWSYMLYNMVDKNGNAAPLTGPNIGIARNVGGYWFPAQNNSSMYKGYPNDVNFAAYYGSPPAFMYELIESYTEDTAETGGGEGDYGMYSDSIGFSELPTVGFDDTGFTRMYAPVLLDVQSLAAFLWSDSFLDNIKVSKDNAMNCIINLGLVPLKLANVRGTTPVSVKVGNVPTGLTMPPLTDQYLAVDMGEVAISEKWGTSVDYINSRIECFLPFVGFVQLPTSEVLGKASEGGGKIAIQYNINLFSGEFVAQIRCNNRGFSNVLSQHSGNMMYSCPFSAANYSNFYKNILGGAVQMIASAATGNIAGAITAGASTAVNALAPTTVQRSGTISGGSAVMGGFTPYLIIRRPVQHLDASGYGTLEGFPSYVYRKLSTVNGFVQIEAVKMDGFTGTQEEAAELERLLKEGVYL